MQELVMRILKSKSVAVALAAVVAAVLAGSVSLTTSLPAFAQTQTIAGHIFDCTGGTPTTTEVPGGTLGATGPQTVATQPNPLGPTSVAPGIYTMSATSPSSFQLVACDGVSNSPTQTVVVPSGGSGTGIFYVSHITQIIAGHIFDCTGGTPTTTEVPGGTLGATGPQTVATQPNPLNPTSVAVGTYTMSATSPSGFQFVQCGSTATIGTPPTSATESVTVPSGGSGVGIFYVAKTPTTCTASSSADAAGNSGQVQPGQFLWFNFHFVPTAKPSVLTTYVVTHVQTQFTDTLTNTVFTETAPSATITVNDTSVSTPTSNFVGPQVGGHWVIQIPPSSSNSDEIFLTGFAFQNPTGANIQPKNFNITANFNTSTGGTDVRWQFGVALYNSHFMDFGYNGLGVLLVHQADHAGTPELQKGNFIGGAGTGGGGSNFTGSWSSTGHAVCQ
jgi:hypothetical protein